MFVNPKHDPSNQRSIAVWTTDEMTDNNSAGTVRQRIVRYYYNIWGSNISVTREDFDADDIVTDDSSLSVKHIYTVTVLRQIDGPSYTMASVVMSDGGSNVSIEAPFQESTMPMSGRFYIECPNADGNPFVTRDFGYGTGSTSLDFYLQLEVPHLQFKTYLRDTGKYSYVDSGKEFMIIF